MPPKVYYHNFQKAILDAFTQQKFCDVTFSCLNEEDSWEKISAHKFFLASASDVFETIFYGESRENDGFKYEKEIKVDGFRMRAFKLLLSFIYYKNVNFDDHSHTLAEFFVAAHKYNCQDALRFAKDHMKEGLNAKNCIVFYETALIYDITDLQEACLKIFVEKTKDILNCADFLNAHPNTIEVIYQLEPLTITSEQDLISTLEYYIKENETNDPKIAQKVRPAINSIRFLTLAPSDVAKTSLLSPEEIKSVIESLPPQGDLSKMPVALSVNCNKRGMVQNLEKELMRKIRALHGVYSEHICYRCMQRGLLDDENSIHPMWDCKDPENDSFSWDEYAEELEKDLEEQHTLKKIYEKYEHTFLVEYDASDVESIYNLYKSGYDID